MYLTISFSFSFVFILFFFCLTLLFLIFFIHFFISNTFKLCPILVLLIAFLSFPSICCLEVSKNLWPLLFIFSSVPAFSSWLSQFNYLTLPFLTFPPVPYFLDLEIFQHFFLFSSLCCSFYLSLYISTNL